MTRLTLEQGHAKRPVARWAALIQATTALLGALVLLWVSDADAATRCVATVPPPPGSGCIIYPDLASAQAASVIGDEVKVYGSTLVCDPAGVSVRAGKLTGVAGATLDARCNPGIVLRYDPYITTQIRITDITILVSGNPESTGIQFGQAGSALTNLLDIIGPPGGQGVGVDILPGVGRVTLNTTAKQPSSISGVGTAIRAKNAAGRPSPNGFTITDVHVCMESIRLTGSGTAQWFKNSCSCGRSESIGFRSVGTRGEDHNGNVITDCDVGIQIECTTTDCGARNQWDNHTLMRNDAAVRAYQADGSFVDDFHADPACADQWGNTNIVDGARLPAFTTAGC